MPKRKKRAKKTSKAKDFSYVTNHIFVPKHSKISEKERKELLEIYHIDAEHLPKIFTDDPAIQDLEVKAGDIVKIVRKSPTAGEIAFYRNVIEGI